MSTKENASDNHILKKQLLNIPDQTLSYMQREDHNIRILFDSVVFHNNTCMCFITKHGRLTANI